MTTRPMQSPLARVRAAELGRGDGPTDGRLLARFVEERDEAALGALVRRLGPAVLGVCRRVIGDAIAAGLQRNRDGVSDATRSPGHQRDTSHSFPPSGLSLVWLISFSSRFS